MTTVFLLLAGLLVLLGFVTTGKARIAPALVGFLALFLLAPSVASAASDTPVGPDADVDSAFNLDPYTVTLILGSLIPLINGLVTKATTSSAVKAIITLVLSAVAGIVNVSLTDTGGAVISQDTVKSAGLTLLVAIATYVGVYKPLDLTSSIVTNVDANGNQTTHPGKLAGIGVK